MKEDGTSKKKLAGIIVGCIVIVVVVVAYVHLSTICYLRPLAVDFADPNLEAAVREAIGKPEGLVYPSDLEDLTFLDAADGNIIDLTGLEWCLNLTELVLEENEIGDITPLSDLTNLELLNLNGNQVDDISALSNLTNLSYLYLADNEISDITSLSSLVKLGKHTFLSIPPSVCLDLSHNQISDIAPLVSNAGFGEGDEVDLQGNPLSAESVNTLIPQLEARRVEVSW